MESEGSENKMGATQISVGGFNNYVTAKMLLDYFDEDFGPVLRCRLKTSSTPPDSYPNFSIDPTDILKRKGYQKVKPHAYVHFEVPNSAKAAVDAAERGELILDNKLLKASLGPKNPYSMRQSKRDIYPYRSSGVRLAVGMLVSPDEFFVSWEGPPTGVDFVVDPFYATCQFLFTRDTVFSLKGADNHAVIKCNFKIEFSVVDINEIKQCTTRKSSLIILLQLASSPLVYYRTADDDIEEPSGPSPFDLLDDDDPWIRTTDFTPNRVIGRCTTYGISIPRRRGFKQLREAIGYFKEQRVQYACPKQPLRVLDEHDSVMQISGPFFCIQDKQDTTFEVMFLVSAVMHKGIMNQHQLSDRFFDLLRSHPEEVNIAALKHIYSGRQPVFDICNNMERVQEWLLMNPGLLSRTQLGNVVEVKRLVITPTRAYCLPPTVELSNRVLRNFKEVADRFLRVSFMDEGMETLNFNVLTSYAAPIVKRITKKSSSQKTTVFERIQSIAREGFNLCGRRYSFLAFSSNQLRDHSAWFFAEDEVISVPDIISWMGKFKDRNVAKRAARMGQCFSSTCATVEVPHKDVNFELPDIERNGYVFSDGIGMLTPDLAMEVAERLQLSMNPPCAYQIRYAGCKGVIACWPGQNDGFRLSLRPSMIKFESNHTVLEICSWSTFQPGFLNRQIVTLLSALDVPDRIFWEMQQCMILKLDQMMTDIDVALNVLTASCAEQGNTAAMMLSAGFQPQTEPHLQGMLTCIRAAQLWGLREKAKIFVPSGRCLLGCFDEVGVLEQGQCFIQVSTRSFANHGSRFSETKNSLQVIKGSVVVAKNPCLHPGDIRILEAVDAPALHHLFDCLVFPQKGDRPHANEASGSDLDGDHYFVTWDENLIPPSKTSWDPMDYAPAKVKVSPHPVSHEDIIDFFTENIGNDQLGKICNAHVVRADISDLGALDENCIKLAELAAKAVDFPKTGKIVTMPSDLKPELYPDFMGKESFVSYKSEKIMGRLYREITDEYDIDLEASTELKPEDIPYDSELVVPGSAVFIADAWNQKCSYEGQLRGILGHYKVTREEEVVTGHIWSIPKCNSRKREQLLEKLNHAYCALRKEFKQVFERMSSDFDGLSEGQKNEVYQRKASAWYQVTYDPSWVKRSLELRGPDGDGAILMLSFPWVAVDYLCRIKLKCQGTS